MDKQSMRRELIKKRREFANADLLSKGISAEFMRYYGSMTDENTTVFIYVGCEWEVKTDDIITQLINLGARVCVPRCLGDGIMQARMICGFSDLEKGRYGLLEPKQTCAHVKECEIDLCAVPAVAFDVHGYRLGRGGGYYDRFLPRLRNDCRRVGLMFDEFILDKIPNGVYDCTVGEIISENGVKICS